MRWDQMGVRYGPRQNGLLDAREPRLHLRVLVHHRQKRLSLLCLHQMSLGHLEGFLAVPGGP